MKDCGIIDINNDLVPVYMSSDTSIKEYYIILDYISMYKLNIKEAMDKVLKKQNENELLYNKFNRYMYGLKQIRIWLKEETEEGKRNLLRKMKNSAKEDIDKILLKRLQNKRFIDETLKQIHTMNDDLAKLEYELLRRKKNMNKGIVFIVGETGSGKDTVARQLQFNKVVSYSTRPMRNTDIEGINHHFITEKEAKNLITRKDIIAYTDKGGATYFALGNELKPGINIYIINPDGIRWFKEFGPCNIESLVIYLHTPLRVREERCKHRSDFNERFYKRVIDERDDYNEFRLSDEWDIMINNKNSQKTAELINKIIIEKFGKQAVRSSILRYNRDNYVNKLPKYPTD